MGKKQQKHPTLCNDKTTLYPSAELLQSACYEDYRRLIDTYDKIYEKINIALAFSGVILLVVLSNFDYTLVKRICNNTSNLELFTLLILGLCSIVSTIFIVWAVIELLLLMRSCSVTVFDSTAIRSEKLYKENIDVAAMWLIDKYTIATSKLKDTVSRKQKTYDSAILKLIIALLNYALALIIQKGV